MTPRARLRFVLLVLAALVTLIAGCDHRTSSHTYHCADGTAVVGPGATRSSCDSHGGLA